MPVVLPVDATRCGGYGSARPGSTPTGIRATVLAPCLSEAMLGELPTRQVLYLSPTVEGKKHDKKLADEVALSYPVGTVLHQDTGFQGYAPAGVTIRQPKKNPRAKS